MAEYFLSNPDGALGPFEKSAFRAMGVTADTAVREGADGFWSRAGDVEALQGTLAEPTAATEEAPENLRAASSGLEKDISTQKAMNWGPVKRDGCRGNGLRQYSAILWDIPWGEDWGKACARLPNTINGHYFPRPTRCKHSGTHMWGEWDVPDGACVSDGDFNAVVFLLPNEPINLGHVGYGFKLSDGRWMYGSKELIGSILVMPGDPNGVFLEKGSKADMFRAFATGGSSPRPGWDYKAYKALRTNTPAPAVAEAMANDSKKWGYFLAGNNCMDDAVKILNTYALGPIVPLPPSSPDKWIPNLWFKQIWGTERKISDPF